jgi:hypothetical protein
MCLIGRSRNVILDAEFHRLSLLPRIDDRDLSFSIPQNPMLFWHFSPMQQIHSSKMNIRGVAYRLNEQLQNF